MPKIVEAQCEALKLPNTGVAATQDMGTFYDIHPPHKKEVGRRLSLIALNKTYNITDIVYAVLVLNSYKTEGEKMILQIETPGSELYLLPASIGGFGLSISLARIESSIQQRSSRMGIKYN